MNFIKNETAQKLRGGYYTPLDLAIYISRWASEKHPHSVLEPSCGDGIFLEALAKAEPRARLHFTGFELFDEEAVKAKERCLSVPRFASKIHSGDFLDFAIKQILEGRKDFDCVVGNPPSFDINICRRNHRTKLRRSSSFSGCRSPNTRTLGSLSFLLL